MINTYEKYLKHKAGNILKVEDAMKIYREMADSIIQCKIEDKMDFWNSCLTKAATYAKMRNDWETMSMEEHAEKDGTRTDLHESFIISLNMLSRVTGIKEVDGSWPEDSWRGELGDDRKRIGDYACFISYITGISNR